MHSQRINSLSAVNARFILLAFLLLLCAHNVAGSLNADDWRAFSQLDTKELARGKVTSSDERKQHEVITKIDSQFKEHKIDHLDEEAFLPVLEQITANLKATQLNKGTKQQQQCCGRSSAGSFVVSSRSLALAWHLQW